VLSAATTLAVTLQVFPSLGLIDGPLFVHATGMVPGSVVGIVATTRTKGIAWRSEARCRANAAGAVDLATCNSVGGTYRGIDPGGLLWSMMPSSPATLVYEPPPGGSVNYTIDLVVRGKIAATASARRVRALDRVVARTIGQPVFGTLALPPSSGKHAAIILLGGSDGGDSLSYLAPLLASHDFVTLSLAYFGAPGLPKHLVDVPIESVGTAVEWLSAQPQVDASRIGILGISKGGELALLAASTYRQVRAVVSVVGAPFAMYGIDVGSAHPNEKGSWSKAGAELPFVPADSAAGMKLHTEIASGREVSFALLADASVANNPAAVSRAFFPLERIAGPVLCIGAGDDRIWNSARNCEMTLKHLRQHDHPFPDSNLIFDSAGHDVLTFNYPTFGYREVRLGRFTEVDGGTPQSDGRANEIAWPAILKFLKAALRDKLGNAPRRAMVSKPSLENGTRWEGTSCHKTAASSGCPITAAGRCS
jgi:dienelactone hydrolase